YGKAIGPLFRSNSADCFSLETFGRPAEPDLVSGTSRARPDRPPATAPGKAARAPLRPAGTSASNVSSRRAEARAAVFPPDVARCFVTVPRRLPAAAPIILAAIEGIIPVDISPAARSARFTRDLAWPPRGSRRTTPRQPALIPPFPA